MKPSQVFLFIAGLVFFSGLFKGMPGHAAIPKGECERFLTTGWLRLDRYREMPGGPFKGRSLSYGTPSPPLLLLDQEQIQVLPEPVPEGAWAVSNFMAQSGPSFAIIPHVAPKRVTLVKETLVDGTTHLLLRLVFPEAHPVHYWPQNIDGLAGPAKLAHDIVLEFGNQTMEGDEHNPYTPIRGLHGRYALQSRMGTTAFKARLTAKEGRTLTELKVGLNAAQKLKLFEAFFERTNQINQGEMYNTLRRNCVTELKGLFSVIGILKPDEVGRLDQVLQSAVGWTPKGLIWALRKSGARISGERPVHPEK